MKNQSMKNLWIPIVGLLLFVVSCKKQDIATNAHEVEPTNQPRLGGVVPDDPELLAKLPLIVSRDFLARQATTKGPGKGKGGYSGGTTTDQTAPNVSITSPAQSASVSGTVSINVSASDNVGVTSVTITVNGSTLTTLSTAPYAASWNTTNYADGVYTLEAMAKDAAGNWSKSTISVSKNTVVVPPPPSPSSGYSLVMPPVGYQGGEGSCVAFAVGYGARSADYYYKSGNTSYSYASNVFSPEFIYNQTKAFSDCGAGSSVLTVLEFLKNTGVCTWQSMPYSYTNGCSLSPNSSQLAEAANYKIGGYGGLYKSDVQGIKSMLLNKKPVVIAVNLDNAFINAKAGFIWKSYSQTPGAGHALVICGYDDSKNAWKVMNSWGTGWCEGGYGWIDYDFLPKTGGDWTFVLN